MVDSCRVVRIDLERLSALHLRLFVLSRLQIELCQYASCRTEVRTQFNNARGRGLSVAAPQLHRRPDGDARGVTADVDRLLHLVLSRIDHGDGSICAVGNPDRAVADRHPSRRAADVDYGLNRVGLGIDAAHRPVEALRDPDGAFANTYAGRTPADGDRRGQLRRRVDAHELVRFEDYVAFAPRWRDEIANVRIHETTRERPVDRFQQERSLLRPLPTIPFDTDEIVSAVVSPHARIEFDGNRYSAPPAFVRRPVTIHASRDEVRVLHEGQVVAQHVRCYQRGQLIVLPDHRLAALAVRKRSRSTELKHAFDALRPEARQFHLRLKSQPVKTGVHLRRLMGLARLYGTAELLAVIARALELATYDAAYVENLLLAERRRRELPTPTLPNPRRRELIDEIELDPTDPAIYDRFCDDTEEV